MTKENPQTPIPYKLGTDGFAEQDIQCKCPECDTSCDLIGWGNYPVGGFRNARKPFAQHCLVFECPKCFTKSVCHDTLENIRDYMADLQEDGRKDA